MELAVILFDDFESLDVFGPVEVFGKVPDYYELKYYSVHGGTIRSRQQTLVLTQPIKDITENYIMLLPGGQGTRVLVNDDEFLETIKNVAYKASFVLTVCTGSGLLAKTGLLKGRKATSNKIAFDWAVSQDPDVNWIRKARWVKDSKYYTSSGISAGTDMALGFIADMHSEETADKCARRMEYIWNKDKENDPFAAL